MEAAALPRWSLPKVSSASAASARDGVVVVAAKRLNRESRNGVAMEKGWTMESVGTLVVLIAVTSCRATLRTLLL